MDEPLNEEIRLADGTVIRARKNGLEFFTRLTDAPRPGVVLEHKGSRYEVYKVHYGTRHARVKTISVLT